MTVDCEWISKNLEALSCDGLTAEQDRLARGHLENCRTCGDEVRALNAIDPLIRKYFLKQLSAARAPKRMRLSVVYVGTAALLVASISLFMVLRTPTMNTNIPVPQQRSEAVPAASSEVSPAIKTDAPADVARAKPQAATPTNAAQPKVRVPDTNGPDFLVTDPAGYSRTLEDYRGYVLLIGLWSNDQPGSAENLERLYKAFSSNTRLRFVGVSAARQSKPANTTFPSAYNQGSKLLGAHPGDFVLVDEGGNVSLRGSLTRDFDTIRKRLQGQ